MGTPRPACDRQRSQTVASTSSPSCVAATTGGHFVQSSAVRLLTESVTLYDQQRMCRPWFFGKRLCAIFKEIRRDSCFYFFARDILDTLRELGKIVRERQKKHSIHSVLTANSEWLNDFRAVFMVSKCDEFSRDFILRKTVFNCIFCTVTAILTSNYINFKLLYPPPPFQLTVSQRLWSSENISTHIDYFFLLLLVNSFIYAKFVKTLHAELAIITLTMHKAYIFFKKFAVA